MRPDVILFVEAMPMQAVYEAQKSAEEFDVCIVVGTSALVYPAAELPLIAKRAGAIIIKVNPEETALSGQSDISLRGKAAEILPLIFAAGNDDTGEINSKDSTADFSIGVENSKVEAAASSGSASGSSKDPAGKKTASEPTLKSDFMTSETHPIRVDFLERTEYPFLNRLGLTFAPGKKQLGAASGNWDRDLKSDCSRLRHHYQTDTLVSLVEESELTTLGIADLEHECRAQGIELIRFPLKDFRRAALTKTVCRPDTEDRQTAHRR